MPPEMTFGRSVRFRRTKIGLSQTRLGELVGRSSAAVRSWERDASVPTDPSVLEALSAVLGIDKQILFEKAGIGTPAIETSPTVEEALGTLAPVPPSVSVAEPDVGDPDRSEPELEIQYDGEADGSDDDSAEEFTLPLEEPVEEPAEDLFEESDSQDDDASADLVALGALTTRQERPQVGFASPVESIVYTVPAPPVVEPTYIEDESQRQVYRLRNLATLVLAVGLIVMFFWAMSNGWSELNSWWDEFFGQLQL